MSKKIAISVLFVIAIMTCSYLFLYQEHRDIKTENADYVVSIANLEREFDANYSIANAKYLDQTIQLLALVTSVDEANNGIVLGNKVFCTFSEKTPATIVIGTSVTIKGRFLGYDELLEEFKIDQISIIN
jgi:hypothetical protein